MKTLTLNKHEIIDIDDQITLTIEDTEEGGVMFSIQTSDENYSIDLEKVMALIQAHKESKGGQGN